MMRGSVVAALLALGTMAGAQETQEVRFAPGNYGTMVEGAVRGNAYLDYTIGASEGQRLFAEMQGQGGTVYFNVMPPGADWQTIFLGQTEGEVADLILPEDGTYTIRVYQMGNAADTGAVTPFMLDLSIQ